MFRSILAFIAALLIVSTSTSAAGPAGTATTDVKPLTVGDAAPTLEISHWLKGAEIARFEPGKMYVVEFWATWCAPCRQSMPHLTSLQTQYKDYGVTFLGISDEPLETVTDFLKKDEWNAKTGYTVATDPDRSAYFSYMLSSGNEGIPTAFVVGKDGRIEWIGHPMDLDATLEAIVKNTWNRDAFKAEWEPKMSPVRARTIQRIAFEKAKMAGDHAGALAVVERWLADDPKNANHQYLKFTLLLKSMNEPAKAYAFGREMVKSQWDNAQFLNRVAWFVVDDKGVATRDLAFAKEAAERSVKLTEEKDPSSLDTLARIHFDSGDTASAIQWQRKAVETAKDPAMKDDLLKTLQQYEQKAGR